MKITKKILQDIIKEELANVLQEQDPQKQKEKIIADKKAKCKKLAGKAKTKCEEELKKLEADLAGPGENADQAPKETKK